MMAKRNAGLVCEFLPLWTLCVGLGETRKSSLNSCPTFARNKSFSNTAEREKEPFDCFLCVTILHFVESISRGREKGWFCCQWLNVVHVSLPTGCHSSYRTRQPRRVSSFQFVRLFLLSFSLGSKTQSNSSGSNKIVNQPIHAESGNFLNLLLRVICKRGNKK